MATILRRALIGLVGAVVALALVAGYLSAIWLPQAARRALPQTGGELTLVGLDGPVDVYRDSMGIPHIYADTPHDLFMAQGFVHAQDRFWQMDFWRHLGSGRLAEMFGEDQAETDALIRTLGWVQVAEQEYAQLPPDKQAILDAYAEGVNAYIASREPADLSLEYTILTSLLNRGYQIEPWTPVQSLTWGKVMAWDLGGNLDLEIERTVLLKSFSPEQLDELFPAYPADNPRIVQQSGATTAGAPSNAPDLPLPVAEVERTAARLAGLNAVLNRSAAGIGSNSWVVSGELTASGKPMLANDPHLGIQMPSIWYQVNLHCRSRGERCPFDVGGFSFAGVPGIIIGHNNRIAWGYTDIGPDVMDLYILRLNPDNPNQYEFNGAWLDFERRSERIHVAGGDPLALEVRVSRFGPVISSAYEPLLDDAAAEDEEEAAVPFRDQAGIELPERYALALRWTALEPGSLFAPMWDFNKAQNWDEFRAAARAFTVPAQNLIYADVDGNIGYQMPGHIPIRRRGDGRQPVPGWTDEYDWAGYIPFEQLPSMLNPPSGYIVTANNQITPDDYPYLISTDWDYGFRARRIVELIEQAPEKIDVAYFQQMQGDGLNLNAEALLPALAGVAARFSGENQAAAYELLQQWDRQDTADSQATAIFESFWRNLLMATFTDELPEASWPAGDSRWIVVMRALLQQPDSPWWDDKATAGAVETRDDLLLRAFAETVATMEQEYGKDPAGWPVWGDLHSATFRNATLGDSGIGPVEDLFNRGPFPVGGGESLVNSTSWTASESFEVDELPSMRMIVDLSDLNGAAAINTTGQSGHTASPHYSDMIELWRTNQYYPMLWSEQAIAGGAEAHLRLMP